MLPPTITETVGQFIVEVAALGMAVHLFLWVIFCFGLGQAVRWSSKFGSG